MARTILNEISYCGAGCRKELAGELARKNMKRAFVVTDKDLIRFGVAKMVLDELDKADVKYEVLTTSMQTPPRKT